MSRARRIAMAAAIVVIGGAGPIAAASSPDNPYDDPPPLQATNGLPDCPTPPIRVLDPEAARREAHQRVERGTSCWLAGQCEAGGDYKDDGVVNARVAAAIAADGRFARTSVWVETLRKFVTLKGCIDKAAEGPLLASVARAVPGVKLVWLETKVVASGAR